MGTAAQLKEMIERGERAHDMDLRAADFNDVDFSMLNGDGLDLRDVDLRQAKMRKVRFGACRLEGAKLEHADWSGAIMRMCLLDGVRGAGARFDDARIEDSSVKGADLTDCSLRRAKLTETSFERSALRQAVLDDAEGEGVQLRGADLSGATLIGARLADADFRGADLSGADLSRGRFQGADFRGAILDDVRWTDADLRGAVFDKGAGPVSEPAFTPDSAGPPPFGDADTMTRLLEALLKSAPIGTSNEPPPVAFPDLGELGDSTELRDLLKALEKTVASGGLQSKEVLASVQNFLAELGSAPDGAPPEAWKSELAQILTGLSGVEQGPNLIQILGSLLGAITRPQDSRTAPNAHDEDIGAQGEAEARVDTEQTRASAGTSDIR